MEEFILTDEQHHNFLMEALIDLGYGYPGYMDVNTYIGDDDYFHMEVDSYTIYNHELVKVKHVFKRGNYMKLIKYSLKKHGYDIEKVYGLVNDGTLKISVKTNVVDSGYTYGKRRKR